MQTTLVRGWIEKFSKRGRHGIRGSSCAQSDGNKQNGCSLKITQQLLHILFIYFISLIVFLPIEYYLGFYKILISIVILKQMGLWCGVRPYTLLNPALTTPLLCPSSNKTGTYKQD